MAAYRIEIVQNFPFSVARLYDYLSVHENLGSLFGATVVRVRSGEDSPNGVGSVRKVTLPGGLASLEETVTKAVPNKLIEYKITKGGFPMKNHLGIMRFSGDDNSANLHYTIDFDGAIPLAPQLLKLGLGTAIASGLKKLAKRGV